MKSRLPIFLSALLVIGFTSVVRAGELKPQHMNFNLWGNGFSSVNGNFSSSVKSTDFLGANARFRPYVGAGIGLYPFRLTDDGISGEVQKLQNGNKFEKTSFGLNGSAGVEFLATDHMSIIGGARYHYLFSKDDEKFGANSGFGNQGLLSYGLGLAYHFPFGH
ncbi:MAG: outer membrane protein [bacterium]